MITTHGSVLDGLWSFKVEYLHPRHRHTSIKRTLVATKLGCIYVSAGRWSALPPPITPTPVPLVSCSFPGSSVAWPCSSTEAPRQSSYILCSVVQMCFQRYWDPRHAVLACVVFDLYIYSGVTTAITAAMMNQKDESFQNPTQLQMRQSFTNPSMLEF